MSETEPTYLAKRQTNENPDVKYVKIEKYDIDIIGIIIKDRDTFAKKDLSALSRYKKNRLHGNTTEVVYHFGKGCEKLKIGRVYPHNCLGLQSFPHDIRNPLLEKFYWDVDMENCHYKIIRDIGKKMGFCVDAINQYIENREEELAKVSAIPGVAKTAFLKVAYGGDVKLYDIHYVDDGAIPEGDLTLIHTLKVELERIVNKVWSDFPKLQKLAMIAKKPNPRFSLFALILQTEEFICLQAMDEYCNANKRYMGIFIHDGGEIEKLPNEICFPEEHLRGMERMIEERSGYKHKLVVKPFKHNFKPPAQESHILIQDDVDACEKLAVKFKDFIVRTPSGWFVKFEKDNWWSFGENAVKQMIISANFAKINEEGDLFNYGSNNTGINAIYNTLQNCLIAFPINQNFVNQINEKTKGKVFYKDKYWHLSEGKWYDIAGSGFTPLVYINRPAPDFTLLTEAHFADFNKKIMCVFTDKAHQICFLQAMARAIGGHIEDKIWYILEGMRNSGKGTIQEETKIAFPDYCVATDAPIVKSFNSGDASELRWIISLGCNIKRIAFTNEAKTIQGKTTKLCGNTIKKVIASGGDDITARNHHQGEITTKMNCTTFMAFNQTPKCDPADAFLTCCPIIFPYKYVSKDKIIDMSFKEGDSTIKGQIQTNTVWRDVFTKLVFDNYKSTGITESSMPASAKMRFMEITEANATELPYLLQFKFDTNDKNAWISMSDIMEVMVISGKNDVHVGKFLNDRGFEKAQKTINKIKKWGYKGLKLLKKKDGDNFADEVEVAVPTENVIISPPEIIITHSKSLTGENSTHYTYPPVVEPIVVKPLPTMIGGFTFKK
jgi:hypothetical protein